MHMTNPASPTVLIVDDELFFRHILREMLEKGGFTVVAEASNGADAALKYSECRPTVVLMDIYMPDMNGIEATCAIISADPAAKILICSGTGYDDDINAALKAGASGIIYKPFYDEEVLANIRDIIAA
jgi:two-component system chemotaxis response regulator CheY